MSSMSSPTPPVHVIGATTAAARPAACVMDPSKPGGHRGARSGPGRIGTSGCPSSRSARRAATRPSAKASRRAASACGESLANSVASGCSCSRMWVVTSENPAQSGNGVANTLPCYADFLSRGSLALATVRAARRALDAGDVAACLLLDTGELGKKHLRGHEDARHRMFHLVHLAHTTATEKGRAERPELLESNAHRCRIGSGRTAKRPLPSPECLHEPGRAVLTGVESSRDQESVEAPRYQTVGRKGERHHHVAGCCPSPIRFPAPPLPVAGRFGGPLLVCGVALSASGCAHACGAVQASRPSTTRTMRRPRFRTRATSASRHAEVLGWLATLDNDRALGALWGV